MKPFIRPLAATAIFSLSLFIPEWFDQQMADTLDNYSHVYFRLDSK